jgi:hypothetical protein
MMHGTNERDEHAARMVGKKAQKRDRHRAPPAPLEAQVSKVRFGAREVVDVDVTADSRDMTIVIVLPECPVAPAGTDRHNEGRRGSQDLEAS